MGRVDLHRVEARRFGSACGGGKHIFQRKDFVLRHLMGRDVACLVAHRRHAPHGFIPAACQRAAIDDLRRDPAAFGVDGIGEPSVFRYKSVIIDPRQAVFRARLFVYGNVPGYNEPHAAAGQFLIKGDHLFRGMPAGRGHVLPDGGTDETIFQCQRTELFRFKQLFHVFLPRDREIAQRRF